MQVVLMPLKREILGQVLISNGFSHEAKDKTVEYFEPYFGKYMTLNVCERHFLNENEGAMLTPLCFNLTTLRIIE